MKLKCVECVLLHNIVIHEACTVHEGNALCIHHLIRNQRLRLDDNVLAEIAR